MTDFPAEILVVEDDAVLNQLLVDQLDAAGYRTHGVGRWSEVDTWLGNHEPRLILTDAKLPDGNAMDRLPSLTEQAPVIVLTAYGSVQQAVDAIQRGAAEYLVKPINPDELRVVVARTLENARMRQDYRFCRERLATRNKNNIIGSSPALLAMQKMVAAVAPSDMTVLIQGESGSGKELVADSLHHQSGRHKKNFIALDCCTLQEKLFESELFGHERGAFTGADRQKKGLIEAAEGGTLFLDEIGEIEAPIQAKLLRVLETGRFRRLGGIKDLNANVRVVAATNRDLERMSEDGEFRSDLYFRLSAFVIEVPPLRERRGDIVPLCQHFLHNLAFSRRNGISFSAVALEQLQQYDWPGNIRELRNVVERAMILSRDEDEILPEHLSFGRPRERRGAEFTLSFGGEPTLEEIEAEYLEIMLDKYDGHRSRVARAMGVSERNVYRMIKRCGL